MNKRKKVAWAKHRKRAKKLETKAREARTTATSSGGRSSSASKE